MNYCIPEGSGTTAVGYRATRLRALLGMSIPTLAAKACITEEQVEALERGADVPLSIVLAIHKVLSGDRVEEALFATPRLETIDDVERYERRRLATR